MAKAQYRYFRTHKNRAFTNFGIMMNMKRFRNFGTFYILTLILSITFFCEKKSPEPIVGRVGKTTLPVSEFRDRFELTPHILQTQNEQQNKINVLASLLGEKLLVEEARRRKLHKDEKYQTFITEMEKEAVVEKLFEEEIASKIEITEQELKKGYVRSQIDLSLKVLTFDSLGQAIAAKYQIDQGKSMTEVKREFQTDTFISADSILTLDMEWGEAHPKLEDTAYNLKPNQVSDPVFVEGRYFILKLTDRRGNIFATEADYLRQVPSIRKKIKQRKRAQMFSQYFHDLMKGKEARVAHEMFDFVAAELGKAYGISDTLSKKSPELPDALTDSLSEESFVDRLNETFIRFNDGTEWSVEDFIKRIIIGPYKLNIKTRNAFRNSLNRAIKRMIEFETLAKEGREKGYDKTYYVDYQTKMWGDSFLGQIMRQNIIDTVTFTPEEIEYHYQNNKSEYSGPDMVKLHEILVDDKSLAEDILKRIKNGADMKKLARKYNKRELSIKTDGVMGYFTTSALGKVGEAAKQLDIGEIGGPIRTEKNQYSVFKILDKREAGPLPLEQVWDDVKKDALAEKQQRLIDGFLSQKTEDYEIEINRSVLDTLETTQINALILKRHYANRTAAPTVQPLNLSHRWQNYIDEIYPKKPASENQK